MTTEELQAIREELGRLMELSHFVNTSTGPAVKLMGMVKIPALLAEIERLREALEEITGLGYNEACLFCGLKDRAAKEALEGGMTFTEAIKALESGKKVVNAGWYHDRLCDKTKISLTYDSIDGRLYMGGRGFLMSYRFTMGDVKSNDWYLV